MNAEILPLTAAEAARRDNVLRGYVVGRDWGLDAEQTLVRELVIASAELIPDHPFLVGVEWDAAGTGRGDLLFFDGAGRAAVVEVKNLGGRGRNKGRNVVESQARRFAAVVEQAHPDVEVVALVYTNDESRGSRPPRDPADRERW